MPPSTPLVTKNCPVCDRSYTGKTDATAIAAVRNHLQEQAQYDEAHAGIYNSEGWWNDYGN